MPDYDDEPMLIESLHDDDQAQPVVRGGEMAEASEGGETMEGSGTIDAGDSISGSVSGTASAGSDFNIGTGFPKDMTSTKAIRDKFNSEIDADEAEAEERTKKVDEDAGDTPVLSQLEKASAWMSEQETKVADGALRGAVDMGTGLVDMATAPPPGPADYEKMAKDFDKPIDLEHAAGEDPNVLINGMKNTGVGRAISKGKYADAAGQAAVMIGSFFVGGELGEAGEMGAGDTVPDSVVPDTVPDTVVPDTVPDTVVPDTVPAPDAVPDTLPSGPDAPPDTLSSGPDAPPDTLPSGPDAPPDTVRSPVGPPRAPVPDPQVPTVDPPPYEADPLPPTVPTRLLPGGPAPTPAATPDLAPDTVVDPPPDVTPPASPAVDPPPNTLRSTFDPTYKPHPGEPIGYPPHGGAGGPWTTDPVPPMVDRYGSEYGQFLSPEGTPIDQRALGPRYNPDAAEQMGYPPDYDVGYNEYGVYKAKPGTTALQSPIAPAYGKPGGSTQIFTGPDPEVPSYGTRLNNVNGDPIVRPDGTTVQPRIGPNGKEIPVPGVDRTGGPYSYQYGHTWKVEDMDPAERDELEAMEREQNE